MAMIEAVTCPYPNADWERLCFAKRLRAVADLVELVEGPAPGQPPQVIRDPVIWVHQAFDLYRSGMAEDDRALHALRRIEHDFVAGLYALNFDDVTRQLRLAVESIKAFDQRT